MKLLLRCAVLACLLLLAVTSGLSAQGLNELTLRYGDEPDSGWTWHEGSYPNEILTNETFGLFEVRLTSSDREGNWCFLWFNAYIDPAAQGARADELRNTHNLVRRDLVGANSALVLNPALDYQDRFFNATRPLVLRPGLVDLAGNHCLSEENAVRSLCQAMLTGSDGVKNWELNYESWNAHLFGGTNMNDVWSPLFHGTHANGDLISLVELLYTAVSYQSANAQNFGLSEFKDAVEIGVLIDVQAVAFMSVDPTAQPGATPDLTSGLINVNTGPTSPIVRWRLSDPCTIRIPVSTISRGGDTSEQSGGPGWVAVQPGARLELRLAGVTPGSSVIFPTTSGPVAMPLIRSGPMLGETFVPNDVTFGFIDLVNAWGTNVGSQTHSTDAPMLVLPTPVPVN